mgnify:CR=1 FL=1
MAKAKEKEEVVVEEKEIEEAFIKQTQWDMKKGRPYVIKGSEILEKRMESETIFKGFTGTAGGFYGPQGRILRLGLSNPSLVENLTSFRFGNHRISNFEMETSAIYGMGKILGHHCLSLSAIVANRISREFSKDGNAAVENLIKQTLSIISSSI